MNNSNLSKNYQYKKVNSFERSNYYPHGYDACRGQVSSWRTRLLLEQKGSGASFNVVLTFDNEHYPSDRENLKDYLTCFWKRIRRAISYSESKLQKTGVKVDPLKLKYFQISEFGSKFGRLHVHVCLFASRFIHVCTMRRLIEEKWGYGYTYVRYLEPRHNFYNTKYITKRYFFDKYYKSQSNNLGVAEAVKVADFCWSHDHCINIYDYERVLPKYLKEKIYTPEQLQILKDRYARRCYTSHHNAMQEDDFYINSVEVDMLDYNKAYVFLCKYFCTTSWPDYDPLSFANAVALQRSAYKVIGRDYKTGYCKVRWFGIFAQYFANIMHARVRFAKDFQLNNK